MMDERLELERGERGPSFLERVTAPHTYAILFFLAVLAVVGTWLLPAGEFDRVTGLVAEAVDTVRALRPGPGRNDPSETKRGE